MTSAKAEIKFPKYKQSSLKRFGIAFQAFMMSNIQIDDLGKRFFKFKNQDEEWKVKYFNSEKRLFRFIRKNNPKDCYFSISKFLDKKAADKSEAPIVISKDVVIDVDDTTYQNSISIVEEFEGNIDYILQTSENSLQIKIRDLEEGEVINRLDKINADYCSAVFKDKKRVCRVPLSIHKSGFKTRFLDENLSGFKGVDEKEIKKVKEQQKFYYRFLRQKIHGTKDRYVLAYKHPIINEGRIKYLQRRNLGDCYILHYPGEEYHIIFPKAIQHSQLKKLQKSQQFIRISKERGVNGIVLKKEPILYKIIESDAAGYYSFPHMEFLRKLGAKKMYAYEIGKKDSGQMGGWQRGGKI